MFFTKLQFKINNSEYLTEEEKSKATQNLEKVEQFLDNKILNCVDTPYCNECFYWGEAKFLTKIPISYWRQLNMKLRGRK